jgi:hypothetical protein
MSLRQDLTKEKSGLRRSVASVHFQIAMWLSLVCVIDQAHATLATEKISSGSPCWARSSSVSGASPHPEEGCGACATYTLLIARGAPR